MPSLSLSALFDPVIQTYFRHIDPPNVAQGIRYAIAQAPSQVTTLDTIEKAIKFNLKTLEMACMLAKQYKVQLISFPELFLSGYAFGDTSKNDQSVNVVRATAEFIEYQQYTEEGGFVSEIARANNMSIICPFPYVGKDPKGKQGIYDAAVVFDNKGRRLGLQYKNHLWGIDERRWFTVPEYGPDDNPYPVFTINGILVGVAICYDAEFPEVARCLALNGAVLAAMPTAAPDLTLPGRSDSYPDVTEYCIPANAVMNQNFCSYGNRAGAEFIVDNGLEKIALKYSGNSVICCPYGTALVKAVRNEHALLIADCIMSDFPSIQPTDTNYLINRRPDTYSIISQAEVIDAKTNIYV